MSKVYNRKTEQWEFLEPGELEKAVSAGTHSFEADLDIPIVNPQGKLGTANTNDSQLLFQQGYRYATPEDLSKSHEELVAESNRKHFDMPVTAAGLGAIRGITSGFADLAARGLLSEEQMESLRRVREESPIASALGEIGGSFILGGGIGAAARAGKLGKSVQALTKIGQTGAEATVMQRAGAATIRTGLNMGEGALYGAGQGVSEWALGSPDSLAENILSNAGLGALWAGMFAAPFQITREFAPLAKKINSSIFNLLDDLVQKTARKVIKPRLTRDLTQKGEKELAEWVETFITQPEQRTNAIDFLSKNPDILKQAQKETADLSKEAVAEVKKNSTELKNFFKKQPQEIREKYEAAAVESGEYYVKQAQQLYSTAEQRARELDELIHAYPGKAHKLGTLVSRTEGFVSQLEKQPTTMELAKSISGYLRKNIDPDILQSTKGRSKMLREREKYTRGSEFVMARNLKEMALTTRKRANLTGKNIIDKLVKDIDKTVLKAKNVPTNIRKMQDELDTTMGAYGKLIDFMEQNFFKLDPKELSAKAIKLGEKAYKVSPKKMLSVLYSPHKARDFRMVLENFTDFVPELIAHGKGFAKHADNLRWIGQVQAKINQLKKPTFGGEMDLDNTVTILRELAGDTQEELLRKTAKIQQAVQETADRPAIDAYINLSKAMGRPVAKHIEEVAKLEPVFEKLNRLKSLGADPVDAFKGKEFFKEYLKRRAVKTVGLGTLGGYVTESPEGALLGAGIGMAGKAYASNPYRMLKTLTEIEKFSHRAAQRTSKAISNTVGRLTRRAAITAPKLAITKLPSESKSTEQKRKEFRQQAEIIHKMSDPEEASKFVEVRLKAFSHVPEIQQALANRMITMGQFLAEQVPTDPHAQFTLTGSSNWTPNDSELAQFHRYLDAVESPITVVERIGTGDVTTEEIAALRTVYPDLYANLQEQLMDAIMEKGSEIPYRQRLTISHLFDIPGDPTLNPQYIAQTQATYQAQARPEGGRPPGARTKIELNVEDYQTPASRITHKA